MFNDGSIDVSNVIASVVISVLIAILVISLLELIRCAWASNCVVMYWY